MASTIDPTLDGDMTADGRVVQKSELQQQFTAAVTDIDALQAADLLRLHALTNVVTLAELGADKIIIPAVTGKQIVVYSLAILCDGTFTTGTSVEFEDSSATIEVAHVLVADLADNDQWLTVANAEMVLGAGFGTALTVSESMDITETGSHAAGTSITVYVTFKYV